MASVAPRPRTPQAVDLTEVAACSGASATVTGPVGLAVPSRVSLTGVTLDSRAVRPGDLYAALPGANVHGASFGAGAIEQGAHAILTDRPGARLLARSEVSVPVLVVPDPRAVLGTVAALVYGRASRELTMVGITGTNGKTTTAYLLDAAWRALGRVTGLIGTVETRIGDERIKSVRTTPESPDLHALFAVMRERGVDTCTMEVSSHALSLHRVDGVVFDVVAFTNLSRDHLDFHGSMEDYYLAKASLFTPERARRGVVCVDDPWGQRLARDSRIPVTTVTSRDDVQAHWRLGTDPADGAGFVLARQQADDGRPGDDARLALRSALPGDFNRLNTAVAALVLLAAGVSPAEIEPAIVTDAHVPGRMESVVVEPAGPAPSGLPLAVVDFAHTPDAVAAALSSLRRATTGALVAVLGAGGDRDPGKRAAMGAAASFHADVVVVTDDNPRSEDPATIRAAVREGTVAGAARVVEVPGRAEAIRAAVTIARGTGDTVVVLGKGHESGQEIAGTTHPFDDREELRAALLDALGHQDGTP